ncbi:MAG: hypothetical protein KIH62_001305 [Candidatus Kerfeldbacteria bacterium]|nr:hypothetical protein [Candidatus Kerfeldbacteria bacterium]
MSDNVNFIPDDHHKKPQKFEEHIEYTEGEKNEPQPVSTSLVNVEDVVKKTQSSFLAWRMARQAKREQVKKEKEEREAQERARIMAEEKAKAARTAVEEKASTQKPPITGEKRSEPVLNKKPILPLPPISPVERPHAPTISAPVASRTERPQPTSKKQQAQILPNDQITSVNLIPDSLIEDLKAQNRLRDLGVVAGLVCVLIMTAYSGFTLYAQKLNNDTHDIVTTIGELDQQIATKEILRKDAQAQADQLTAVQEIVNSHIEWLPFFHYIEQWTLPTVFYENVSGSATSGAFTFAAVTSDIRYVTEQVATLRRSPAVLSVNTTSATQAISERTNSNTNTTTSTVVNFVLTVQFKSSLFHAASTNVNTQ